MNEHYIDIDNII